MFVAIHLQVQSAGNSPRLHTFTLESCQGIDSQFSYIESRSAMGGVEQPRETHAQAENAVTYEPKCGLNFHRRLLLAFPHPQPEYRHLPSNEDLTNGTQE